MPHVDLPQAEFKVVLLGDTFTGKTSLVLRFAEGYYRESARNATVGAFFITKRITVPSAGLTCKIQIWDTAGQEQFKPLAPMYYSNSAAAILCYDPASPRSLETLKYWLDELHRNVPAGRIVIAMAACKCDLLKTATGNQQMAISSLQEVEELAGQMGAIFVPTSAKNNDNVSELFTQVAERVLQYQKQNKGNPASTTPPPPPTTTSPTHHKNHHASPRMLSPTGNGVGLVPRPDSTLNHHQRSKSASALPPSHMASPGERPVSPHSQSISSINREDYLHRRSHHNISIDHSTQQQHPPGSPSRSLMTDPNRMNESPILQDLAANPSPLLVQEQQQQQSPYNNTNHQPAPSSSPMCGDTDYLSCASVISPTNLVNSVSNGACDGGVGSGASGRCIIL